MYVIFILGSLDILFWFLPFKQFYLLQVLCNSIFYRHNADFFYKLICVQIIRIETPQSTREVELYDCLLWVYRLQRLLHAALHN